MGNYDSGRASDFGGINIEQRRADSLDGVRFDASRSAPTSSNDCILYRNGTDLVWWNGTSSTVIGSVGAVIPSLDGIFAGDKTLNVAGTTLTIDNSTGNNNVLTLTNSGAGSGALIQFDNAGSGSDIDGTNDSWYISKTGVAILEELTIDGTEGSNIFTVTKGDVRFLDGALAVTDDDNAASFTVTNNTATTASVIVLAGSGAFTGSTTTSFMTITPSGLTTGTAVYLPVAGLTEGKALHIVANAITSGIAIHVSSSAAGTQLTGAGRLLFLEHTGSATGSGTLAEISSAAADETDVFKVTASGALTGGAIVVSASSLATGTAFEAADLDALTTGIGLHVASSSTGVTTGSLIRATNATTGAVATNGVYSFIGTGDFTVGAVGVGMFHVANAATTAGTVMSLVGTALTTGVALYLSSTGTGLTSGSLIRATTGTTGAVATNGVYSFVGTGNFTVGAVGVGMFNVAAASTTAGTIASFVGTGLTTGVAVHISSTGTGMTSGSLLRMTTGTTGAVATNGVVSIRATGAYTSTSNAGLLDVTASAITGTATLVNLASTAAAQTDTRVLNISSTGYTTGYNGSVVTMSSASTTGTGNILQITSVATTTGDAVKLISNALVAGTSTILNLSHTTSVLGAGNSMARITSTSVDTGTTTGVLLDLAATAATSGTLMLITSATVDSGIGFKMDLNGLTTGEGMVISHTTSVIASGGSLLRLSSTGIDTGTTTGILLDLSSTASTSGTQVIGTFSALTDGIGVSLATAALTTGTALLISAVEATIQTTGFYLRCYDGAANDFSVSKYGATVIAGSAIGTASLTQTAGDHILTSGNLTLTSGHIKNTPQAIVNANTAISIVTLGTTIANDAGSTHTLADGTVGQLKYITCTVYVGDAVITPANFVGTTITLNAAGDSWLGVFAGTEWRTLALGGTAAVA